MLQSMREKRNNSTFGVDKALLSWKRSISNGFLRGNDGLRQIEQMDWTAEVVWSLLLLRSLRM